MQPTVMNGAPPFLPEEIITNILKRLPVKSLIRFQCVCKRWKNLFKTPSFIADHLRHSNNQNPSFMFFQNDALPFHLCLLDCEMQVRDVQKALPFDSDPLAFVDIIGSINGLLCVAIGEPLTSPSLSLWNPATRDVREVSRSRPVDPCMYNRVIGFGFSPSDNDYKIVKIYAEYGGTICAADVYSVSRDSWKQVEVENLEDVSLFVDSVSCNGSIFLYGSKPGGEEEEEHGVVVSFDIGMEVFTLIPWPVLSDDSIFTVSVYEDKPAILTEHGTEGFSNIDLWVWEEDIGSSRERWSWTKKFTSFPCPRKLTPEIIWRNEIVMSCLSETEHEIEKNEPKYGLCLFNITTNEFKMLATPQYHLCSDFHNYVESLVPVVNIHDIEEA